MNRVQTVVLASLALGAGAAWADGGIAFTVNAVAFFELVFST